jgi:hypothetical protein
MTAPDIAEMLTELRDLTRRAALAGVHGALASEGRLKAKAAELHAAILVALAALHAENARLHAVIEATANEGATAL